MRYFSTVMELIGLALFVWGAYLFDPRIAVLVGGLVALLIGFAIDQPTKGPDR